MLWNCNTWPGRIDWLGYLHENTAPILIPMWYLRDLLVFFILTPIIFICIKKTKQYILIILALSYVSNIWPQIPGFSNSIIFFVIGSYFAINKKNIIIECYRYHKHIFIITILLLPLMIILDGQYTQYGNIIYPFFILVLVPFYINTTSFLMKKEIISPTPQLSKVSFFIYASHIFILDYCAKLLKIMLPSNIWYISTIRYLLIPILCIITCYILYIIMRKITPKLLVYLTGNRQ